MRYVVGLTKDSRGRDAISLATTLAQSLDDPGAVEIDLVHVISGAHPDNAATPQEREYQRLKADEAEEWMAKSLFLIPKTLRARATIHFADSMAEGILEVAAARRTDLIIVGAASHGPFRRFTVGSVANALLHTATAPVALAPAGYLPPSDLTRITCALGTRTGAEAVLQVAVDSAVLHRVPLRIISLVSLDAVPAANAPDKHAERVLEEASASVDGAVVVSADIARGRSTEAAIESLDWSEGEIVLIGSSRLAQRHTIFLGTTANKMLRSLPVPMVVIPRYHPLDGADSPSQPI